MESLAFSTLILEAHFFVQLIMLLLVLFSILVWVFVVERMMFFYKVKSEGQNFEDKFWSGVSLDALFKEVDVDGNVSYGQELIFRAGFSEFRRSNVPNADADKVLEATARSMRIALIREEERLNKYLPFLAMVASASPYIGLLGTVWGIMNSFRGLAVTSQASLATVAPGISEALIATAMGLFAAIPAAIAYNNFASNMDTSVSNLQSFSEELQSVLHRQAVAPKTPRAKPASAGASS